MGKSTNETIKTRVAALKGLILSGSSNSTCVEHAAQQWGVSRRQSYHPNDLWALEGVFNHCKHWSLGCELPEASAL